MNLEETIKKIKPLDEEAMEISRQRWDSIAHPLHSLGLLEDVVVQINGITGQQEIDISKKVLVPMCADNGVVEEGVTQTGQEVTAIVANNFLSGVATAGIFCRVTGADIFPVDIGIAVDTNVTKKYKIAYGTKNIAKEPAMTYEEAVRAIEAGIAVVEELAEKGYRLIATGEMGIGNTTTSSAIASVLLEQPVEAMTGRGAGLSSEGLNRKIAAIKKAIELHQPDKNDPIDVLAKVGGYDVAGIVGLFLGGAAFRIPVLIDGFISGVGALAASRICPQAREYMIASHVSEEPAGELILKALGKEAFLHAHMCLGEGTGAVAVFPILDIAATIYTEESTFHDISMENYEHLE